MKGGTTDRDAFDEEGNSIGKRRYYGYPEKYDEWVNCTNPAYRPKGTFTYWDANQALSFQNDDRPLIYDSFDFCYDRLCPNADKYVIRRIVHDPRSEVVTNTYNNGYGGTYTQRSTVQKRKPHPYSTNTDWLKMINKFGRDGGFKAILELVESYREDDFDVIQEKTEDP